MSIVISESDMNFGEYDETKLFQIEKSSIYRTLGKGVRTVEFVLYHRPNEILFIEAKSSSPKSNNQVSFNDFITEISEKFTHSIDLYFSLVLKRLNDESDDMPECFKSANYAMARIKLLLVINGHQLDWLRPISDSLKNALKRQLKTWNLELAVLNHELAEKYDLLCNH